MDKEDIPGLGNTSQGVVKDNLEAVDSKGSNSSTESDTSSPLGGFLFQGFQENKSKDDGEEKHEDSEEESVGEDDNPLKQEIEEGIEEEALEDADEEAEIESKLVENISVNPENESKKETEMPQKQIGPTPTSTDIPKMKSRFVMSNQQIRDFIDPDNQKYFNEQLSKINGMLETTQKEYCLENFKGAQVKKGEEFQLENKLLGKLVYGDELDLAGNFLQVTVGRRLNDEDMPKLVEFLMSDTAVAKLNLAYNDFTDDALMILAGLLLIRTDIVGINLAHNNMSPAGCLSFTQHLMQRRSLYSLKLAGMKIGEEGFNGLICLVMCGRGPYDLDLGETDMKVASFQGLCTAWQAVDQEDDFPKYLTTHPLPTSLEQLADIKKSNNETRRKENNLEYRRSLVELVTPKREGDGDGDSGDCEGDNEKNSDDSDTGCGGMVGGSSKKLIKSPVKHEMEKIPRHDTQQEEQDSPEIPEKVSATVLKGLFEIPELQQAQSYAKTKTNIEGKQGILEKFVEDSKQIPDTDEIIKEYHKIQAAGCISLEPNGKPVIVCPSLYSLDIDDVLQIHTTHHQNEERQSHFIPSILDEMMEEAEKKRATEGLTKVPDDESANKASIKVITRAFQEAAQVASATDYQEKSDTAQLLLSIILDTCQQLIEKEDSKGEFKEQELQTIWTTATEQAMKVLQKRVPAGQCSMTQNEVRAFVRKFMESTNRTFLNLLRNPFIPPLLIDVATKTCRESVGVDRSQPINPSYSSSPGENIEPSSISKIVMSFLEGAVSEAAHLIGTGDPHNFRGNSGSLLEALERTKGICDRTEAHAEVALEDFFLAGTLLAQDSIRTKKELELIGDKAEEPATDFVEALFDKVARLIINTQEASRAAEAETPPHKYPFAARVTRLVLNRPLFQDYEPIMAAKFGDFIGTNTTVKCLHMRKWNLGEDGMINLMDGLAHNTNIVLLDLGSNAIGSEGAKGLAKFIMQNKNLKHLLLNHNRLRNPGLKYITEALTESNLTFLNIAYNDISDESLDPFVEILSGTQIQGLHAIGNHFSQNTWKLVKQLFDSEWLLPELCDFCLQEVDGKGMIVKNTQMRDTNEWYDVPPLVAEGLSRPLYFEESAHLSFPTESN